MSAKIIVSYDGTANEDDAITLGRLFGKAGAQVALAYVRHTHDPDSNRETLAQAEAQELLDRGVELLGNPSAARHVVTDRSTPEGLQALAAANLPVRVVTASVDERLNDSGYIVPGLGDAGDRQFGAV